MAEVKSKKCKHCKQDKKIKHFNKDSYKKDGFCNFCRECRKIRYINSGKERVEKENLENNQLKKCSICLEIKPHKEFYRLKKNGNKLQPRCKKCFSEYHFKNREIRLLKMNKHYDKNKEIIKISVKKWRTENKHKVNSNQRRKIKENKQYKIAKNLRSRVLIALKAQLQNRKGKTYDLLGCNMEFFIKHIESQFKKGMSWDNYGLYGWHLDHIKPCAAFNLSIKENQYKCFYYSNYQPLWRIDNIKKGAKYGELNHNGNQKQPFTANNTK